METLLLLPFVGWFVLWVCTLCDAGRYSDAAWSMAGESRTMRLLLILVLQSSARSSTSYGSGQSSGCTSTALL